MNDETPAKPDAHLEADRRRELARAIELGNTERADHIAGILGEKVPGRAKLEDRKAKQPPVEKRAKK